ncbi:MAG: PilN domain-containing protein [Candidatus Schekmanbacteria bacterium]|nr:PilN domain-containing protein [Candidatus Schekmanbacteria bacterium]
MIRINVLPVERGASQKIYFQIAGAILLLVATLGAISFLAVRQSRQLEDRRQLLAESRKKLQELQRVLQEIQEFEKERQTLETKLNTIKSLRESQRSSVELLNEISIKLPDGVWLDRMVQRGDGLTIDGVGVSWNFISEFVAALKDQGRPAEERLFSDVIVAKIENRDIKRGYQLSYFSLRCRYRGK